MKIYALNLTPQEEREILREFAGWGKVLEFEDIPPEEIYEEIEEEEVFVSELNFEG